MQYRLRHSEFFSVFFFLFELLLLHCASTVVGGGVSGLTTALQLVESGWTVRLLSAAFDDGTVSSVAGALWELPPTSSLLSQTDHARYDRWCSRSWHEFNRLAHVAHECANEPPHGVSMRWGINFLPRAVAAAAAASLPSAAHLALLPEFATGIELADVAPPTTSPGLTASLPGLTPLSPLPPLSAFGATQCWRSFRAPIVAMPLYACACPPRTL
jgi:glycine/D-amino acid oxidase-like deaminating enzyme